jgi:hypothetical protein
MKCVEEEEEEEEEEGLYLRIEWRLVPPLPLVEPILKVSTKYWPWANILFIGIRTLC